MGRASMRSCVRALACSATLCLLFMVAGSLGACLSSATAASTTEFGSEGEGAGQFKEPRGIAIDQETGDVFIADRNNHRIDEFTGEGKFVLAWGWGVADGSTEALQKCSATCFTGLPGAGAGQFSRAEGIAVDNSLSLSRHDVYVLDTVNHRVEKFGPEGEFLLAFGSAGKGPGQFEGLTGRAIAVDSSGTVYVGDEDRVQEFNEVGTQVGEVKLPGVGLIENLAVDSAKDLYVKGSLLIGVRKFNGTTGKEEGSPRDELTEEEGRLSQTIALGPADELFVNDLRGELHHILIYDPLGGQSGSFASSDISQEGKRGIAYSEKAKALYIVNSEMVRIRGPPPPGPLVGPESETTSKILPTSATLEASINPEGPGTTKYHFEYGTTTAYGASSPEAELSGGEFEDQPVSAQITGLTQETTYHFRAVATRGGETTFGPDQSFTTLSPVAIDSLSVAAVNATSARLEAELNPHGLASEYCFEYGTAPYAEGQVADCTKVPLPAASGSGTGDVTVKELIQELLPSTTYHYRVIAHNTLGTSLGHERSFTTQGASSTLPDGRAWEQVSPANKHGAPLEPLTEEGGLIQSAAGGGAFAYVALGPVNEEPKGVRSPEDSQLLARRGPSGWETEDITTAHEEIALVIAGFPSEYKLFSEDLSSSIVEPVGATPLSPQTSERTPYRREASGQFSPLVTAANVLAGTHFGGDELIPGGGQWANGVEFRTASPDLSHVVLESPQILTPGFKAGFVPTGAPNLYELSGGSLSLVSTLPGGEPAAEAGLLAGVGNEDLNMRGAISSDGSRVVFVAAHLYLHDSASDQTLQLDEVQAGAAGGAGEPVFQAANSDDSKVLFSDTAQLTSDSHAALGEPDLYMCEISEPSPGHPSCALSDLSVDHTVGEAANVAGEVSAIDETGSKVYFAADGVLTNTPNARGEHAVPGQCESSGEATCNMYEYDTDTKQVSLVAVLSSLDSPDWVGHGNLHELGNLTARSSPDGHYFTFMSERSLSGYDNRDVHSGKADEEVFQFDSETGALSCVSCDPSGARPQGVFDPSERSYPGLLVDHVRTWPERWLAGSIPGWTLQWVHHALYQSRYLSDSGREFFDSADALVPQDTNGVGDVYEYEPPGVGDCATSSATYAPASGGCISLISSGSAKEESAFLDASENGDEAFFLTQARLTGSDTDSAFDVYDAHVCSTSSPCPPPPPAPSPACQGDACQNPSSPPNEETPSSLTYKGPGNAPPPTPAPAVKPKPPTKAELLAKALKACKAKKQKKKRLACEKQARAKYGAKKAAAKTKGKKASRSAKRASSGRKGSGR